MADDIPAPVSETGVRADLARAVNQLSKALRRRQLRARPGQKTLETPNGTFLDPGVSQGPTTYMGDDVFY